MPDLPTSGVELVAKGADAYVSDINKAADATTKFFGGLSSAGGSAGAFGEVITGALRHIGEVAVDALGKAAQATAAFLQDGVTAAGDFQQGMLDFQAVAGADVGAAGLEKFKDLFISLGKELPVSTAEVQQAATEMVKGGIDPAAVAAGGLRQVIQFAAAADLSLADAATISAKALAGWVSQSASAAEKADFLTHSTDEMTKAANASAINVDDLALGLYNVQGTAKLVGQSFDETVTVLAQISPGFASAADAGTSYKMFLSRLNPTTKPAIAAMKELGLYTDKTGSAFYDAQGNYVGAAKAAELLHKATAGLTNEQREMALQTIFGQDAVRAAAAIAEQGAAGYNTMAGAMDKANGVAANAAIKQQGYNTALENAKGSIEALQITIGSTFLPVLTDLINKGTEVINIVTKFADTFGKLAPAIGESSNPLQTLLQVLGIAASSVFPGAGAGLIKLAGAFSSTQGAVDTIWGTLTGFLGDVGGQLVSQLETWAAALGQWVIDAMPGLGANLAAYAQLALTWLASALPPLVAQLATWGAAFVDWLIKAIPPFLEQAGIFLDSMITWLLDSLPAIVAQLGTWAAQFVSWLVDVTPKVIVAAADLLAKFLVWFNDASVRFHEYTQKWQAMFTAWITEVTPKVIAEAGKLGQQLLAYLNDLATKAKADGSLGKAIIDGIVKGINSGVEAIKTAATNAAKAALDAAKRLLKTGSPSKVFEDEVGLMASQGFANGILAGIPDVQQAVNDMVGSAVGGAQGAIADQMQGMLNGKGKGKRGSGGGGSAVGAPPVPLDYSGAEGLGQWAGFFSALTSQSRAATALPPTGSSTTTVTNTPTVNYAPVYQTGTPPPPMMDAAVAASMVP